MYCVKLKHYRDKGVRISNFFGKHWFISRLLGVLASVYFMYLNDQVLNILGYLFIGFIGGAIAIDIRTVIKTQKYWPLQKEIIDWDKVEKLAEN